MNFSKRRLRRAIFAILGIAGAASLALLAMKLRDSARRANATSHVKQIGISVGNYCSISDQFPKPYFDKGQKTSDLPLEKRVSWRYSILPFLESDPTYHHYLRTAHLAWDSPENLPMASIRWRVYSNVYQPENPDTPYRLFVGPKTLSPTDGDAVKFSAVKDGISNTILFAEANDLVPWPQCKELPFDPKGPLPPLGKRWSGGTLVGFADGSVRMIPRNTNERIWKAMITPEGDEELPPGLFD